MEHRGKICVIMFGLPIGEIRPQEEGGSAAANPTTREEMTIDHYRPDHRLVRV